MSETQATETAKNDHPEELPFPRHRRDYIFLKIAVVVLAAMVLIHFVAREIDVCMRSIRSAYWPKHPQALRRRAFRCNLKSRASADMRQATAIESLTSSIQPLSCDPF